MHRRITLSPIVRFIGSVSFVILVAFISHGAWWQYFTAGVVLLSYGLIEKVFHWRLFKAFLFFETFVFGIAILSLFQRDGVCVFFSLVSSSSLCVLCMTMFSMTTSFSELLSLSKQLRLPSLLTITLALTYRYSFLLIDESERLRRARRSRTFSPSRFGMWKMLAGNMAQLFIRSCRRGERVHAAMCARGWKL